MISCVRIGFAVDCYRTRFRNNDGYSVLIACDFYVAIYIAFYCCIVDFYFTVFRNGYDNVIFRFVHIGKILFTVCHIDNFKAMIKVTYRNNDFFVKLATAADKEDCTATIICYGRACACALYGATICAGDNCTLAYRYAVCSKRKRACSCVFDAFFIGNGYTVFYGKHAVCCVDGIIAVTARL